MNMRDDLKAFVDNQVSEEERTRILKEAENNPALQAELIELRQISRVIKEEAWQPQPVGLEKTLRALESAKAKRPWWLGPSFNWAVGAACTLILIVILAPILEKGQDGQAEMATDSVATSARNFDENKSKMEAASSAPATAKLDTQAPTPGAAAPKSSGMTKDSQSTNGAPNEFSPEVRAGWGGEASASLPQANRSADYQDLSEVTTLDLEVDDIATAQVQANDIAKNLDGYEQIELRKENRDAFASSNLTFKVPRSNVGEAMNDFRKLGKVQNNATEMAKPVNPVDLAPSIPLKDSNGRGANMGGGLRAGDGKVNQKKPVKDATINLYLNERPRALGGRAEDFKRAPTDVFTLLFRWSPVWLSAILLAWWIARRRAGG